MKRMGVILIQTMLFLVNPVYPQERGVPWDGDELTYVRKFEREDGLSGTRVQVRWSLQRSSQRCELFEARVTLAPEDAVWGPIYRLQGEENDPRSASVSSGWRSANVTKFANEPTADEKHGSCLWEFYNLEKWGYPTQVSIWELEPWPGYQYVILNVPEAAVPQPESELALHQAAKDAEGGSLSKLVSARSHHHDPCVSGFQGQVRYSGQCHEQDWSYYTIDATYRGNPSLYLRNLCGEPEYFFRVCGHNGTVDDRNIYCVDDQTSEWVDVPINEEANEGVSNDCYQNDPDPCTTGFRDRFPYSGQCHEQDWPYYTIDGRSQGVPTVTLLNDSGEPRDLLQVCGHDGVADENNLYCGPEQNAEWVSVPINP